MGKHKHWLKQNDLMYTHDHRFIVVSAAEHNGTWYVVKTLANDKMVLKTCSTKQAAQEFMLQYVRSHPNG